MKKLSLLLLTVAIAVPMFGQKKVELILDAEGVRRTGNTTSFSPGTQRFVPNFNSGWGLGGGVNIWLSDRVSVEGKVAGMVSQLSVQTFGSDFFFNVDLGHVQIYPVMAVVQWHPFEHGTVRPYFGAGAVHTIMRNVKEKIGASGATGIEFNDPTGLLLDGGLRVQMSDRWSLTGDARYVPVETRGQTRFPGTTASVRFETKPLLVSFGAAYRF